MRYLSLMLLLFIGLNSNAQKYICNEGEVSFYSEAPLENIKANTNKATSIINLETGEVAFSIPINSFEFKKSLMQKHFNENYMESERYPKATFSGIIKNFQNKPGTYQAQAEGEMVIHGQKRKVTVEGALTISEDDAHVKAVFPVKLKDYKIKIPRILFSNIAEEVEVTINFQYKPYVAP